MAAECAEWVARIATVVFGLSGCPDWTKTPDPSVQAPPAIPGAADPMPQPPAPLAEQPADRRAEADRQYQEGLRLLSGLGGSVRDPAKAGQALTRAAELGHPDAQFMIGGSYAMRAEGRPAEAARALPWLQWSAAQGHERAQFLLGEMHANGIGIARDQEWAALWYGRAARRGHAQAQFMLAAVEIAGAGVAPDRVDAYKWLTLAERNKHPTAVHYRAALAERLTPAERTRGEDAARRFKPDSLMRADDEPAIRYVQFKLLRLGYAVASVDGAPGPKTRAAIIAYQRQAGTAQDGTVSAALLDRLRASAALPLAKR